MDNNTNCCRTCLRIDCTLTSIDALDTDSIKLFDKLLACVSEVSWLKEGLSSLICTLCIERLRVAYDFRIVCLQSDQTLNSYINEPKEVITTKFEFSIPSTSDEQQNSEYLHLKHFLDNDEELGRDNNAESENSNQEQIDDIEIKNESEEFLLPQIRKRMSNTVPVKSKKTYEKLYQQFMDWRNIKNILTFTENDLIMYFEELQEKMKPSTIWTHYSIIKSVLNVKHNIDISKYNKLYALIKRKSKGFISKKSKTFTTDEIKKFLYQAPDNQYLFIKVAMIFGIMGACRRHELHDLKIDNVQDINNILIVYIVETKTKIQRTFTITGKYYEICKKYINLRPEICPTPFFFLNYHNGKCTIQNIGINKFGKLGKQIATYLELPDANLYTGHCFRRTSNTLLLDCGGLISEKQEEISIEHHENKDILQDPPQMVKIEEPVINYVIKRTTGVQVRPPTPVIDEKIVKGFICIECGKSYKKKSNLRIHIRTHTGEKPFECKYCEKRFYHSSHLREHIRRHTGEKPFQCAVCNKRFTIKGELTMHMKSHTGEKPYACNCCDRRCLTSADLKVHMRTHTGEKPYECTMCGKKFASTYILNSHIKTHTGERPYSCTICDKTFTQSSHLNVHLRKHTGEKFTCKVCEAKFTHSSQLTVHMREHTGKQPYKCNMCDKVCNYASELQSHMMKHTGEKFTCTTCDKKFTSAAYLTEHNRTHTGENLSTCQVCDRQFTRSQYLEKHMRTHTGEKPYVCFVCGKKFTQSSSLKVHLRIHTGEKPYSCNICGKKFTNSSDLSVHNKKHKKDYIDL